MSKNIVRDVTIASGATVSDELVCNGAVLVGFQMPAAWTAGNITFTGSYNSGGTFGAIVNPDDAVTVTTPSASEYVALNPSDFAGVMYLKFVAQNTQAAVRVIKAILRGVE